jgi:hypothetical protein
MPEILYEETWSSSRLSGGVALAGRGAAPFARMADAAKVSGGVHEYRAMVSIPSL